MAAPARTLNPDPMALRIAFDLDGTLADLDSALAEITRRLFGEEPEAASARQAEDANPKDGKEAASASPASPSPEEDRVTPPRVRSLSRRQQEMVWDAARRTENFWETLPEIEPGTVKRLGSLASGRGWEVIFLTQRPPSDGDTTQRQSQRWLAAHGFELPSVFVVSGSRGKVAAALGLDAVVDDRAENCLDVKVDSQARAVLVARGGSRDVPANAARLGIEAVSSVGELLDRLDRSHHGAPSLLGRVKQMLRGET